MTQEWPSFARKLAEVLAELGPDQLLVLSDPATTRFVQFVAQGTDGIRAEISSNASLSPGDRLSRAQAAQLVSAGWEKPADTPKPSAPETAPDGSPNFFIDFPAPVEVTRVSEQTIAALAGVLRIPRPEMLEYAAFDAEGRALDFSRLGIRRIEKRQQINPGRISRRLLVCLRKFTGIPDLDYDEDGDIGLVFDNVSMFIRILGSPPAVRLYAPLVHGARESRGLLTRLNELNSGFGSMHFFILNRTIGAVTEIPAAPLRYEVLAQTMNHFCSVVDGVHKQLNEEFGRRRSYLKTPKSTMVH
ncbi:MAG: type III secretion system chaperone [Acidobacteria bacterium]|nr:type III secretion system chaperone [Acidobacteriota bacterium]